MGPLDIFIGWQPILLAVIVYMLTQLIKSIIDGAVGREKRKASRVLTRIVLPATPPVLGALAAFIPAHPQSIMDYVSANEIDWAWAQTMYCIWGAACGQFADYLYSKGKAFVTH